MSPEASQPVGADVDLEIRVTVGQVDGRSALNYVLHSPNQTVDFHFRKIPGQAIVGSPEAFHASLIEQIEKMHAGYDVDDGKLLLSEIARDLRDLGRQLYSQLFPPEMRAAYRRFRDRVTTLQITSDEPWIPWELVKPFDDDDPGEVIDDDFLCIRFQLTRWLAGDLTPAAAIRVARLAGIDGGSSGGPALPFAAKEREVLSELARAHPDVEDASISQATFGDLSSLLESGGVGLLHFVGHGDFATDQPNESKIQLADHPLRTRNLFGPLRTPLRRDRPLVFLNACRVGRQGWALTGLGGWANACVRQCRCGAFIGPQWAVNDDLAYEFVKTFYEQLKDGRTFGEAAQRARREARDKEPGRLSWLAYSVYAHPNGRLVLGSDADAAPRPTRPGAGAAEVRHQIIDQGRFIAEKTAGFVGRQWIFDAIDRFVREEPRGYFLITGDPGIGKSALVAELVRRQGYLHHFNIRAEGINRPELLLSNLCAQLIVQHGLRYSSLPPEASRDSRFLNGLLEQVAEKLRAEGEKLILLVDALDEADAAAQPTGVNRLYLPLTLPPGVYIVATSRRGIADLRIDCEQQRLEIAQDEEGNLADVQEFIESKLVLAGIRAYLHAQGMKEETFVVEMVDKSQGNFMYLRYVLPEIEKGAYQDRDFSTLPIGLENYYEDQWSRIRVTNENAWFTYKLPVLVALTVVKEPVSVDLIADFSDVADRARILWVLEEWDQFLFSAQVQDEAGDVQTRYRLYHDSFHDFIAGKDEVEGERVNLKAAHGQIADVLWRELYGEKAGL